MGKLYRLKPCKIYCANRLLTPSTFLSVTKCSAAWSERLRQWEEDGSMSHFATHFRRAVSAGGSRDGKKIAKQRAASKPPTVLGTLVQDWLSAWFS
jgi:hypothetical protein